MKPYKEVALRQDCDLKFLNLVVCFHVFVSHRKLVSVSVSVSRQDKLSTIMEKNRQNRRIY